MTIPIDSYIYFAISLFIFLYTTLYIATRVRTRKINTVELVLLYTFCIISFCATIISGGSTMYGIVFLINVAINIFLIGKVWSAELRA